MALTITELINDAARELQDPEHVRWTRADLLDFFNAGQRAFAELRPDEMARERELTLVAGWRQRLPDDALTLIDITNNVNARARRVTKTDLWALDAVAGTWRSTAPAQEVAHFMYDPRNPREYLVYPPAASGVKLRAVFSHPAVDVADEMDAPSVPARWMDALRHFVLFRAWSMDAEFSGNAAMAKAHLDLFHHALGVTHFSTNGRTP